MTVEEPAVDDLIGSHDNGCPKSIVVGPTRYQVKFVRPSRIDANKETTGDCTLELARIRVATNMTAQVQKDVAWHEALHAVCQVWGYAMSHAMQTSEPGFKSIEELFVGTLDHGVLQLIRDNPKFWEWINDGR